MKIPPRPLAFILFLLVAPWFLGRRRRVARRLIVPGPPAEVFPLMNDLRNWPRWTEWSRREEWHFSYEGPPAGVGAIQRWESRGRTGELRVTQSVPDERIAYDVDFDCGKFHFEGVINLEPWGKNTRVTWLAKWTASPNPYARYFDLALQWRCGRDFQRGLLNLRQLLKTEPSPRPVVAA